MQGQTPRRQPSQFCTTSCARGLTPILRGAGVRRGASQRGLGLALVTEPEGERIVSRVSRPAATMAPGMPMTSPMRPLKGGARAAAADRHRIEDAERVGAPLRRHVGRHRAIDHGGDAVESNAQHRQQHQRAASGRTRTAKIATAVTAWARTTVAGVPIHSRDKGARQLAERAADEIRIRATPAVVTAAPFAINRNGRSTNSAPRTMLSAMPKATSTRNPRAARRLGASAPGPSPGCRRRWRVPAAGAEPAGRSAAPWRCR